MIAAMLRPQQEARDVIGLLCKSVAFLSKPLDAKLSVPPMPGAFDVAVDEHHRTDEAAAWMHSSRVQRVQSEGALPVGQQVDVESAQEPYAMCT